MERRFFWNFPNYIVMISLFPMLICCTYFFPLLESNAVHYLASIIVYTVIFTCHKQIKCWVFFLQTFNTIKKLRESSSTSPVAETEGNIMEEVKASCNSYLIWNRSGLWLAKDCISNCSCKPKMGNISYFWNSVSQLIDQTHCFWKIYWENPWTIFLCFIYCSLQIICKFIP